MTIPDSTPIWTVIFALGLGSYALRLSFLALLGGRELPPFVLRHLRYTAAAILPGLVAPLVLFPEATGGSPDPARLTAAAVAIGIGVATRNVLAAIGTGLAALYLGLWLL
ncbi:MAG: AzlD domain-containing protein [Pseudomonadota bacterium]